VTGDYFGTVLNRAARGGWAAGEMAVQILVGRLDGGVWLSGSGFGGTWGRGGCAMCRTRSPVFLAASAWPADRVSAAAGVLDTNPGNLRAFGHYPDRPRRRRFPRSKRQCARNRLVTTDRCGRCRQDPPLALGKSRGVCSGRVPRRRLAFRNWLRSLDAAAVPERPVAAVLGITQQPGKTVSPVGGPPRWRAEVRLFGCSITGEHVSGRWPPT